MEAPVEEVVKAERKASLAAEGDVLLNDTPTGAPGAGPGSPTSSGGPLPSDGEGSESHDGGAGMAAAGQTPSSRDRRVSVSAVELRRLLTRAGDKSEELG